MANSPCKGLFYNGGNVTKTARKSIKTPGKNKHFIQRSWADRVAIFVQKVVGFGDNLLC